MLKEKTSRRHFMTGAAVAGAAVAAPYIRNAEAAETISWKVQTSWPAGVGLNTFKTWCNSIKEKTGGELEFKPYAAKEIVGDFELLDGVKNGVLEAMNSFCVYWVGKIPATAFLSSYLMGMRYPHEWDIFFYGKGGVQMAREIYAKQGLYWVGRIQHGPNIIHSKKPIRSIEDFKGLKLRTTGGSPMYNEPFLKLGASPLSLPLGEVLPNLQNKAIDGAMANMAVIAAFKYFDITKYATYLPGSFTIVSGLTNRRFLKSLGPELEAIVRDEARKHETLFTSMAPKFQTELEAAWKKGGGELITFSPEETKRYLDQVTSVIPKIVGASPKTKEDYEAFLAAAKKYR